MKSEEIIENLLRKKHISPKEALVLLKDIAKADMSRRSYYYDDLSSPYITTADHTSNGINWRDLLNSSSAIVNNIADTSSISNTNTDHYAVNTRSTK